MDQENCSEQKPWLCFNCQLAIDGMSKYGFQVQMVAFQQLHKQISDSIVLNQEQKKSSIEIISTIIEMLGHTGHINKVVLKSFSNQLRQLFQGDSSIFESWVLVESELMKQIDV